MTVEAHGFQPCDKASREEAASAAVDNFADRTFFVTSVTWERRDLFRSERAARLFLDTLFSYRDLRAGYVQFPKDYPYSSAHSGFVLDEAPQRLKPVA